MPKQHSSGGKEKLGSISKQGDRYLRGLFAAGALAVIRYAKIHRPWLTRLLVRRPAKVAAVALANKMTRIAWAMMAKGERYKEPAAPRGVNEIAPGIPRDMKVGGRTARNAEPVDSGDHDNPLVPLHCRMRGIDRDLIRGGHYGQPSCEPHQQAEHMAAPISGATWRFSLPTRSRPHMARSRRLPRCNHSSAIRGDRKLAERPSHRRL
jgi:hypothetical protein